MAYQAPYFPKTLKKSPNPLAYFDKLSTSRWWIAVAEIVIHSIDHSTEVYRVYNFYLVANLFTGDVLFFTNSRYKY
jgi:hypothetical protein